MTDIKEYKIKFGKEAVGLRLDRMLADSLPEFSRNRLKALILSDCVFDVATGLPFNEPSAKLHDGQTVLVRETIVSSTTPQPQDIPLEILHEDSDIIVFWKPKGIVVHPAVGNPKGTIVNALLHRCRDSLSGIGGVTRPGIVHRLDKDTEGIMVAAKNDISHIKLSDQFQQHSIERVYQAVIWGIPKIRTDTIRASIGRHPKHRKKMAVVKKNGKVAVTHFEVKKHLGRVASLVSCTLETGRTHQIRVHMAHVGHPIVGDRLYGGGWSRNRRYLIPEDQQCVKWNTQALASVTLGFLHPKTGKKLVFQAKQTSYINDLCKIMDSNKNI
ncbi:MAG: Ribosomal large subunit pseudouridine synthase D [Alphaproteobacteria bacterium MarineAlpha3_Bin5]|nr:RNA pseudouridine synthase [Magnetovibrio sp.]PPR77552.1 MAG: Ribosomal large subunit pseudouridine synthase D [Alphaproteobacteria bacterium MarineAlpha3_Bin5]